MELTLEQVKKFLEESKENQEVQELLKGFNSVTKNDVEAFLETEEGKQLLQPLLDSYFHKGLKTWKQNNLEKLINEKIRELNPDKTPEQIELEQIKQQLKQMEKEKLRESLKNKALTYLTEKNLPVQLVDYFVGEDEETTIQNLQRFENVFINQLQQAVENRLKADGTELKDSETKTKFTKEQIAAMTHEEINKNWDVIQEVIKN